jgi:hypothetical protein
MIPAEARDAAMRLEGLLRDDALPPLGLVDVGMGSRLSFELAVRVTLADLRRFTRWERAGRAVATERWRRLGDDLVRLHRMAITPPPAFGPQRG